MFILTGPYAQSSDVVLEMQKSEIRGGVRALIVKGEPVGLRLQEMAAAEQATGLSSTARDVRFVQ